MYDRVYLDSRFITFIALVYQQDFESETLTTQIYCMEIQII